MGLAVAVSFVIAACGPSEDVVVEPPASQSGPVPFAFASGNFSGASFDDGLAFLNSAVYSDPELSSIGVVFHSDGTWSELPEPPFQLSGGARLGSTDDGRLVLAANDCDDCTEGVMRLFVLNASGTDWSKTGGSRPDSTEADMSDIPGLGTTVFSTGSGNFTLVDDEMVDVSFTPDRSIGSTTVCTSDTFMFALQARAQGLDEPITAPIQETLGSAWVMQRSTWEWTPATLPPSSVGGGVCTPSGAVFLTDGVEYEYSASDDSWTTVDTGTGWSLLGMGDSSAISADGVLYAVLSSGTVGIRRGPGTWEDTGVTADAVYRLDDGLVGVQRGATTLTPLP